MMVGREVALRVDRKPHEGKRHARGRTRLRCSTRAAPMVCDGRRPHCAFRRDRRPGRRRGQRPGRATRGHRRSQVLSRRRHRHRQREHHAARVCWSGAARAWPRSRKTVSRKGSRPAPPWRRTSSRPGSTTGAIVRHGLLDLKAIRPMRERLIERFSIRVGGPYAAVGTLSGGNMQKVVVARELAEQPKAAAGQPADARRRPRRRRSSSGAPSPMPAMQAPRCC